MAISEGLPAGKLTLVSSLLDIHPQKFGLSSFGDTVEGIVPIVDPPLRIAGSVVKGFGRGAKVWGVKGVCRGLNGVGGSEGGKNRLVDVGW